LESTNSYHLKFNPGSAIILTVIHGMALLAFFPFAFSWSAVGIMFFLYWLTGSLGICLAYHRYLTHRSFKMRKWLAYTLAFIGCLAFQSGPINWAGQHRMHHAGSDTVEDPHSAAKGFWWSHILWTFFLHTKFNNEKIIRDYTNDFNKDKYYQFLDKYFMPIQFIFAFILYVIGGVPWVVWGVFVRLVLVLHFTWLVNSAAHCFGYINFPLKGDLSTNCWWVGLLAWGEGWHNNHHAFPSSARHGLRAWEIDMTWWFICLLEKIGLAKDIKTVKLTSDPNLRKNEVENKSVSFIAEKITRSVSPSGYEKTNSLYF
jgi:fatty-acid desaturase